MVEAGNVHAKDWQESRKEGKDLIKRNKSSIIKTGSGRSSRKSKSNKTYTISSRKYSNFLKIK